MILGPFNVGSSRIDFLPLPAAATITPNAGLGSAFAITTAQNFTLANPLNPQGDGQILTFRITQGGVGSFTIAFGAQYRFSDTLASVTLSTAVGDVDYLSFIFHAASTRWDALAFNAGFTP